MAYVTDRRQELAGLIYRTSLSCALGESYSFELIPMAGANGAGGVEVAYMLAISRRSPLIGQGFITITSQPFTWMAGAELIEALVPNMIEQLRDAVSEILSGQNGSAPADQGKSRL